MFVGLDAASSESGDAWEGFLTGLGERGLRCPLLVISDGAAGLIGALERTMGAALRQRCLVHVTEPDQEIRMQGIPSAEALGWPTVRTREEAAMQHLWTARRAARLCRALST